MRQHYYYMSGDYAKCADGFAGLTGEFADNPVVYLIGADCRYNLGKREEARALAQKGLSLLKEGEKERYMPRLGVLLGE